MSLTTPTEGKYKTENKLPKYDTEKTILAIPMEAKTKMTLS